MIPENLTRRGIKFCLVEKNGKRPFEKDWVNKNYDWNNPKLQDHIKNGGNYGVIGGWAGLVILDFDTQEAVNKYYDNLPETFTVQSATRKLPHVYYFTNPDGMNRKHPAGIDIRAEGGMVVGPQSSINGSEYTISKDIPITTISREDLLKALEMTQNGPKKTNKETDTSRSGKEWREILRLIQQGQKSKEGLDKELIFNAMNMFSKWQNSSDAYKERTWQKATQHLETKKTNNTTILQGLTRQLDFLNIAEEFLKTNPVHYDQAKMWWAWKNNKWEIIDDVDILNLVNDALQLQGITNSTIKTQLLDSLKMKARLQEPKKPKKEWIQFGDTIIDIKNKETFTATPKYFFTNPIPHNIGETTETPVMDKLFNEWVGPINSKALYELIAYCCYQSYPIQLLFCLWGNGRNGKSQYMQILQHFIGKENTTSTELDILTTRTFEPFKLFKKLVCTIGETNFGMLSNSSIIKKLTGGDLIGFEKKGKDPFDDYSYAKIIISSNSLPTTEDTSDGFYRRWMIIGFENEFEESGQEVWKQIPESEYASLSKKITMMLPELLKGGRFTGQGTIQERKDRYISVSNPLSLFIKEHCKVDPDAMVLYSQLYAEYVRYLAKHKRRRVKMKEFKAALEDEGFWVDKANPVVGKDEQGYSIRKSGYYVMGLDLDSLDISDTVSSSALYVCSGIGNVSNLSNLSNHNFEVNKSYSALELRNKGLTDLDIKKLVQKGDLFENPSGFYRLLT